MIYMSDVSATEAARNFADLLDSVEHRGESFVIVRRGKPVARLEPTTRGNGAALKELLRRQPPDREWLDEVLETRKLLEIEVRE